MFPYSDSARQVRPHQMQMKMPETFAAAGMSEVPIRAISPVQDISNTDEVGLTSYRLEPAGIERWGARHACDGIGSGTSCPPAFMVRGTGIYLERFAP